jgi:hypothetical protein
MTLHTKINNDDGEILLAFCEENHVSVSALLKSLVVDFLDTNDKTHIDYIVSEAKKVKQGRPKQEWGE